MNENPLEVVAMMECRYGHALEVRDIPVTQSYLAM